MTLEQHYLRYQKFYVALVGALVSLATIYFGDSEALTVIVNFLTAIGVFALPNKRV